MGTWGSGNFDSDDAGQELDNVHEHLIKTIVHGLTPDLHEDLTDPGRPPIEPTHVLLAVDILALLETNIDYVARVGTDIVQKWRKKYLAILEADISGTGSRIPNYKERRRKVVEETFDRLEKALKS
jgi:hypothetical protein